MKRIIAGLVYDHANNTLYHGSSAFCRKFIAVGFESEIINLATTEGVERLDTLLKTKALEFCFGLQGVGSQLINKANQSLWSHYQVPFLGLHYDHPCYNIFNHFNDSRYVANIYFYRSFLETHRRYINSQQINLFLPPDINDCWLPPEGHGTPFAQRPIKLLFLKTGEKPDDCTDFFAQLPPSMRDGVYDQLSRARQNPNLQICDLVQELFDQQNYQRTAYEKQFWAITQCMDYYLRRLRAIEMVEWLKQQDGAVIIGNGWDFIDRSTSKAEFRPAIDANTAMELYGQSQFVLNTNPYASDIAHERIINGLAYGSVVVSDSNAWWAKYFCDIPALHLFNWNAPLADQLNPIIQDIECAAAASYSATQRLREVFYSYEITPNLLDAAAQVRKFAAD